VPAAHGSSGKIITLSIYSPLFPLFLTHVAVCGSASKEEHSQKRHKIVKNGYNLGRDWFVERALAGSLWKGHGIWWRAKVEWRTGLLEPGNLGASYELALYPAFI
jgi:hypothetical protein